MHGPTFFLLGAKVKSPPIECAGVNRYAQLFRLGNCLIAVLGLMLAVLIASGQGIADHWLQVLISSGVVFFFVAGGNSLNDYLDREVDKIGHPQRPIPSGRVSPRTALNISIGAFITAFVISLLLYDIISIAIVASAIAIMLLYELRTKALGLSGNLSIAWLTGGLFLLGGAVVGSLDKTVAIAAMAFLATLGREIVKDIQDMDADFDRRTLPKRIGKRNAGIIGSLAFLGAVGLSFQPYLAGSFGIWYLTAVLAADGIFIYSSVVHFQNPKKGQTWAKIGMVAALFAFLIGGIS